MNNSKREYFMTMEAEDLAEELIGMNNRYYGASFNPIWQMWQRNTYAYYSTILDSESWFSALQFVGEQGELVKMSVPQARSLLRQLLTLITKQKLAFNGLAKVEKADVTENMRIANAISEQVVEQASLDLKCEAFVEDGLVLGTGFIKTTWRTDWGEPGATEGDTGVIYKGDIEVTTPHIMDMLYNFQIQNWDDLDWVQCRVKRNKWSLIAQHEDLRDQILKLAPVSAEMRSKNYMGFDDKDSVYVYEVYHKPTPALPKGRMLVYCDSKTILYDDKNPYGCIPIEQFKPEPIKGLGFGYPMLSNLLPSQEMYDHEMSCVATNHSALGVQNVTVARGADINVQEISGMNFMYYTPQDIPGGGEPKGLSLLQDSPGSFKFAEMLLSNMQQMSNINAAVRGEIPQSSSGVAIATLTTNALEFLTSYSKNMVRCLEKTMYHAINNYRTFATTERLVKLTGKNYQSFSKKWVSSDLEPIIGMKMQQVNPLMQSMAGRVDIADKAIERNLVTNLQEYVSILDGEPVSKLYQPQASQNDLIATENDTLQDGQQVLTLATDNHPRHIMMHTTLLNDPIIRMDGNKTQKILAHILEHLDLAKNTDPMLMAMAQTGQMPQMPEGMPPGGEAPPGMAPDAGPGAPSPDSQAMPEEPNPNDSGVDENGTPGAMMPNNMKRTETAKPAKDLLGR